MPDQNPDSDQNAHTDAPTDSVTPADDADTDDPLVSRLRLIEDQPLASRADAYASVHEELRAVLEGGDAQRTHD